MPTATPKPPAKPSGKPKPSQKPNQPRIISKQVFTDFAAI